jgi:hypothetical protein
VFKTAQWPARAGWTMRSSASSWRASQATRRTKAFHTDLVRSGGIELVDRIGPCIVHGHAFGGFFGWGVADRRPNLVKGIVCMEINGNRSSASCAGADGAADDLRSAGHGARTSDSSTARAAGFTALIESA